MIPLPILEALRKNSLVASGYSSPNPPVACVITDENGIICSVGSTQKTGENHAEREAYEKCLKLPDSHYLYVTLEPCSHFGRTPPCVDLILEKKPKKLFIGMEDPNPIVRQKNPYQLLLNNGIEVTYSDEIKTISNEFLSGFISRIKNKKPRLILKSALSREGFFKSGKRENIKFSNPKSDIIIQLLRQSVDAIFVGPATVNTDSPALNFRGISNLYESIASNNILFETISEILNDDLLIDFINRRNHQPKRFYCITNNLYPKKSFFEKLKMLDYRNTYFILLEKINDNYIKELKLYSENPLLSLKSPKKLGQLVFENFEFNTIMIEGGNFLYSEFLSFFSEDDRIIEIESEFEIKKGDFPIWFRDKKYRILDKLKIGSDLWKIKGA